MAKEGKSYFDKLQAQALRSGIQPRTAESLEWFRERLSKVGKLNRNDILKDPNTKATNKPLVGRMFMYFYDPKYKEELPYYDKFPLIFMVDKAKGGFYGINLHYLDLKTRALFFDRLTDLTNNKKFDESTRLVLSYKILKGASKLKAFKPCFKHYLSKHITSRISEIPASEWEAALFMPTDSFAYKSRNSVWTKSKEMI